MHNVHIIWSLAPFYSRLLLLTHWLSCNGCSITAYYHCVSLLRTIYQFFSNDIYFVQVSLSFHLIVKLNSSCQFSNELTSAVNHFAFYMQNIFDVYFESSQQEIINLAVACKVNSKVYSIAQSISLFYHFGMELEILRCHVSASFSGITIQYNLSKCTLFLCLSHIQWISHVHFMVITSWSNKFPVRKSNRYSTFMEISFRCIKTLIIINYIDNNTANIIN